MIKASDLKKTSVVEIDAVPHVVENITHQAPTARGGTTLYKIRFRNVSTGHKMDKSYRGDDVLQEAQFDTKQVQYLYKDGERFIFMDLENYEQFELFESDVVECLPFLLEQMEGIIALISDETVLALRMPDVVEMEVVDCPPSMKGASATSRTKPATLATGLTVQVPEYIEPGEIIKVDTRDRKFLSRK